jgi:hypothetical protein
VLLTGALVRDEAADCYAVDPLDGLAWATDTSSGVVVVGPGEPGWPDLSMVWNAVAYPLSEPDGRAYTRNARPVTWYLPLPSRDGEPGSATTFSPTLVRDATSGPVPAAPGGRLGAATIVRHPRDGWRALRLPVAQPRADAALPPVVGCAVRVHLRDLGIGAARPSRR